MDFHISSQSQVLKSRQNELNYGSMHPKFYCRLMQSVFTLSGSFRPRTNYPSSQEQKTRTRKFNLIFSNITPWSVLKEHYRKRWKAPKLSKVTPPAKGSQNVMSTALDLVPQINALSLQFNAWRAKKKNFHNFTLYIVHACQHHCIYSFEQPTTQSSRI